MLDSLGVCDNSICSWPLRGGTARTIPVNRTTPFLLVALRTCVALMTLMTSSLKVMIKLQSRWVRSISRRALPKSSTMRASIGGRAVTGAASSW